ncbi:MAG: hypothetical protein WA902_14395 [Thermosynechococcaceae cyanobacterium]
MSAKKVSFGTKPKSAAASVDEWVETRSSSVQQPTNQASDLPQGVSKKMKRLTLDIPETLHRAIKSHAVSEGRTMVDTLRELLEETYG